jgi:hypothetical protein
MCRSIGVREHGLVAAGWTEEVALPKEEAEVWWLEYVLRERREGVDGTPEMRSERVKLRNRSIR